MCVMINFRYGLLCDGEFYGFEYEEMCELLTAGIRKKEGKEYLEKMREKAEYIYNVSLPKTSY